MTPACHLTCFYSVQRPRHVYTCGHFILSRVQVVQRVEATGIQAPDLRLQLRSTLRNQTDTRSQSHSVQVPHKREPLRFMPNHSTCEKGDAALTLTNDMQKQTVLFVSTQENSVISILLLHQELTRVVTLFLKFPRLLLCLSAGDT